MTNASKIFLAGDHASIDLKTRLCTHLQKQDRHCSDLGVFEEVSVDYPDQAQILCEAVLKQNNSLGILICGTGIGASIAANKFVNIRAALCTHVEMAKLARAHNNANVLCLGARILGEADAIDIMDAFLNAEFEGGRHQRRVDKIKQLEQAQMLGAK